MGAEAIRVLIVDDHAVVREGLRNFLELQDGIGAVGEANDGREAIDREGLELIASGRANKRIALELGIAEKTVKTHVGHVLAKLGVSDRTQAALLAVQQGLVSPADHRS